VDTNFDANSPMSLLNRHLVDSHFWKNANYLIFTFDVNNLLNYSITNLVSLSSQSWLSIEQNINLCKILCIHNKKLLTPPNLRAHAQIYTTNFTHLLGEIDPETGFDDLVLSDLTTKSQHWLDKS
jgi:hypothetical protein